MATLKDCQRKVCVNCENKCTSADMIYGCFATKFDLYKYCINPFDLSKVCKNYLDNKEEES